MPIEHLNQHTHDAGFLRDDWEYHTDASIDAAVDQLHLAGHDGLDANDLVAFIRAGADFGQITDREARQISATLRSRYPELGADALLVAQRFDATMQQRVHELHDCSDRRLSGIDHKPWWQGVSLNYSDPDRAVIAGNELDAFIAGLTGPLTGEEQTRRDALEIIRQATGAVGG